MHSTTNQLGVRAAGQWLDQVNPRYRALGVEWLGIIAFAALVALSAQVRWPVPGTVVPATLQTAAVLFAGFCLRPRAAMAAVVVYILAGLVWPGGRLFAAFEAGMVTVTLGYLLSFVLAAGLVSAVARRLRHLTVGRTVAVALLGSAFILVGGTVWLARSLGSIDQAVAAGMVPFLGPAVVKIAAVTVAVQVREMVRS